MATIARLGIDTSKSLFQLHGVDEREEAVLRKQVRRGQFLGFVAKLAPTKIGVEACGASHYWARQLQALGHEVVLLPPQHVKPYAGHNKNDKIDAAAICEAMSRPKIRERFVAVKSAEQSAAHATEQHHPRPCRRVRPGYAQGAGPHQAPAGAHRRR